ncbi:TipJ family phage tail tip protein [Pseudomonas fluorescens]|uniref:Carbohydrate binding domain protein n=2 Tax=Pseudomonas fluorescens TaxID=294 RepID=A0A109LAQ6_PSEFL|nr:phage tail protein [Pseudomonas fluorescens]KWV84197.1 Carbohydrate binding domain protein [Pseudomonas fluorescens]
MGAAQKLDIHGAKGGESKPKSPVEAPDSLRSTNVAKILIAVGEGEFDGTPTARDIFLDNTPIQDASGNFNFTNVKWEWRPGSVEQTYIPGIPSVDNETSLNIELRSGAPWVQSLTNLQLSAARIRLATPRLASQDAEGNINGYRIEYAVDVATDGGAYQQVLVGAMDGKTTTRYERSLRIDLPPATSGWLIRVRRLTPNSQNTDKVADTLFIAGYTQVIDAKLRYPNTALLFVEFDAEQFTNIPAVTVKCKARRWQVPSNYDPVSRTYTGAWDGTMKEAWTNNPAWITYGICTQDRFGLGRRIKPWMVDKWELYRIAQYCDQLVPDGADGVEPRFLCDMNLQGKADAWSLLRDIAGIYRGMTYWAQGQLVMQADMPRAQDIDYVFTRSNVIDGKISYGSASAKTRFTRCLVSYDNPLNNYDTDVTVYSDLPLQRRLGDKPTEISAIGCTRASEAQRRAKWLVLSNNQDRTISFRTGMEGRIPLPGFIIPVADSLLAGREIGGRIAAAAGQVITLDRDTMAKAGDRLVVNLPGGRAEGRTVESVSGRNVTVTIAYSEAPAAQLQWAIDADDLAIPLYRVMRTARTPEGDYDISALQYEPSKFSSIDTGARLEERPISVIPITVVPPPASVTLTSSYAVDQGIAISTMNISWPAVAGAVAYDVEWRKDSGNWIKVQRTGSTSVDVTGIYSGAYLARVRSVSAFEISSIWKSSSLTNLEGKTGLPPAVSSLTTKGELFGISIKWGFPAGAEDTQRTELWYGPANNLEAATKLADLAYPQADYRMQSLLSGATLFFWARLVDRTGNIGPFYPTVNGVIGQSVSDAWPLLEQVKGQIDESSLAPALNGRINLIDGDGPGSVNARNEQLRKDLEAQIKPYVDALLWDAAKAYVKGDIVRQGNKLYQALAANSGSQPPSANWKDVADIVTDTNALAIRVDNLDQKITVVDGTVIATQEQLNQLQTKVNDPVTGLAATANNVTQVNQRVTNVDDKLTAQTERIDGVYAEINAPMAGSENDLAGGTQGYAGAWSIQSAITDGDYAQGKLTQTVEAQVIKNYATYEETTTALVNQQTATTNQVTALRSDFDGNKATVQTQIKTVSDQASATASQTTQLQTTVNGHTQQFQQQASINQDVNGKITGTYSFRFKFDVNGSPYSTGVGLGIETGANGQVTSRFVIQADQFAIYNGAVGAAGSSVPFAVNGTETYIKSAFIQDGTITNAKIGNYIQSNNYDPGKAGWKLFFDGTFEINSSLGSGQARQVINNAGGKVFDAGGIKRYQWGDLNA